MSLFWKITNAGALCTTLEEGDNHPEPMSEIREDTTRISERKEELKKLIHMGRRSRDCSLLVQTNVGEAGRISEDE